MRRGSTDGGERRRRMRAGIDLFIEDAAYTSVTAATALLMVLALLISAVSAVWVSSRANDTQVAADATAMAGANVVSSYHTTATVLDACVLSMGLAGFSMAGVGLVGLLIPGVGAAASEALSAGTRMIETRNEFARSASSGLERLEGALPFLIAANATRTCAVQATEHRSFTGTALAVPSESASDFPAMAAAQIDTQPLDEAADELERTARELAQAAERTAAAKEAAWIADCGREGMNMQERAARLSGLDAVQNPDYASSITWDANVALDRARAYYRWRFDRDGADGAGDEARANAAARHAFYGYAIEALADASVTEGADGVTVRVELLPRNTQEMRATRVYTDAVWPTTIEGAGATLHYGTGCSGAAGPPGPLSSLSAVDEGSVRSCPVCGFGIADVGRVPAASTSIDNGFEYHLREYTLALGEYAEARERELSLERQAKDGAASAGDAFEKAIGALSGVRPRVAPPGRYGCVAVVVSGEVSGPESYETTFSSGADLAARGAISAAVLAPDRSDDGRNVLSGFLSSLEGRSPGGAVGLVGGVMDLWGSLLVSYGDLSAGLASLMDDLLGNLESFGCGPVASWLSDRVEGVVTCLGVEPVDLSPLKPVLTDSANVIAHTDLPSVADIQNGLRSLPLGSSDPAALLEAIGYEVEERIMSMEITIAEIPLPGGGSIPLTVRVRDLIREDGGGG